MLVDRHRQLVESLMSQNRRRPTEEIVQEIYEIVAPGGQHRLQLAVHKRSRISDAGSGHMAALMQLLSDTGIDCSGFLETDEAQPTVH
jgi:hypothetical protein